MKKRLLLAFMAICASVSSFALEQGEFVYTPQGRFQIIGANQNANNAFQTMDGWTAIGEGKTLADLFITNADGLAAGFNSVASVETTSTEGMYFQFVPTSASDTYVVSFKMKGTVTATTRLTNEGFNGTNVSLGDVLNNCVKIEGNSDNTYGGTNDVVVCNTAEELTEDWQTFNYAIVGDGTTRTYYIVFRGMETTVEIADLQIAPALQFADLRQRDAMLEKLNVYKNCYEWSEDLLNEFAVNEFIANLEAIGNESGQAELDELLATAQEVLDEFLKANMDDYLAGGTTASGANDNYLGIKTSDGNTQKVSNYGDWTATTTNRAFWSNGANPDLGHYQRGSKWNYNDVTSAMGVYMQKTFDPGSYVFAIEGNAAMRENATQSWFVNEGLKPAYGVAYIVKIVDGVAGDTIVSVVKDLEAVKFTPFFLPAKIEEAGTYEIGFKAYCKEAYQELIWGSVVYVKDASLWGKNENKYNQKQLGYEENVRTQITTGRDNLTTAAGYLADASYLWGRDALQAVIDEIEPKIAAYEAMDQDAIIATYDEDTYVNTTSEETGLLQYQVYQEATKFIIAANREFLAVNDTLNSIQTAISEAEAVKVMRLYDAATGKDALQAAIDKAKGVQAAMQATDYSEENADAILAANAELAEAVETFKTTVPASAIATIVDIDFENDAVQNEDTQLYSIAGAAGTMEFSNFALDANDNYPFQQGYWSNGEQLWKGYLRVGNGTGTVEFDATENGSMGTNILKVACDMYVQGLVGRYLGFFLKNVVEGEEGPEDAEIFGLYRDFYNGTTNTNTCNVDVSKIWAKSGGSYNNASPADAPEETLTDNPLQKSHIEVIMDYGTKTMYCTISSINGSTSSEEVALEAIPTKFVLQSNYINNDRRAWFDNLKIERITAGAYDPSGIETVKANAKSDNGAIYNIAGQRVGKDYKGLVIMNGKKMVVK